MMKYESHGGAEAVETQKERIRFYENSMTEMDADRKNTGEDETGKEQMQK